MYDKDNDYFKLSVRDLNSGSLLDKPQTDRVSNISMGQGMFCSMFGSTEEDVLLLEEVDHNVFVNIIQTKDFQFVTVFLINATDHFAGLKLVWECEALAHCIVEHHRGYAAKEGLPVDNHYLFCCPVEVSSSPGRWENVFVGDQDLIIEVVDFSETHLVPILRKVESKKFVQLLYHSNMQGAVCLRELKPIYLRLPKYVSQISPGPKYDYHCSTMRFTISSLVFLVTSKLGGDGQSNISTELCLMHWLILNCRTASGKSLSSKICSMKELEFSMELLLLQAALIDQTSWNDLSKFYACEYDDVLSYDEASVPLTFGDETLGYSMVLM
ncbi:hypothetical protein RJ641_003295, partial [Dillenia turbinata]